MWTFALAVGLVAFALFLLSAVSAWVLFDKAHKPGWAALIPVYNLIVLLEIVGRPLWWLILMFIPFANVVIFVLVAIDLARAFGKGTGFALGLVFLTGIFVPMLAFGHNEYRRPSFV